MAATSRLETALSDGLVDLPAGPASVYRPGIETDLTPLADRELHLQHSHAPLVRTFSDAGFRIGREVPATPLSLVCVPRFKGLTRALVAEATARSDLTLVDGQRLDGVDSLFDACRKRLGDLSSITKAKGRLFWLPRTDAFADWAVEGPTRSGDGFYTTAGVFSDGAVDRGSRLLAGALPARLPGHVVDLGAGWGYLSQAVLAREGVTRLDLVEAEALALDCARLNVGDPRARFHWADALDLTLDAPADAVVMNPPFHTGSKGAPALGQDFIAAAARMLHPNGALWMVANRHLPYEATLRTQFRRVEELPGDGAFKLFHASRPIRSR